MGAGAGSVRSTPRPISGTLITSWVWVTGVRSVPSRWNHGLISAAALPQDVRRSAARRGAKHHVRWLRRGGLTIDSVRADHAAAGAALRRRAGVRCGACTAAGGRAHPATSRRVLAALGMWLCTAAAFSASAACCRRRETATPRGTFLVVRRVTIPRAELARRCGTVAVTPGRRTIACTWLLRRFSARCRAPQACACSSYRRAEHVSGVLQAHSHGAGSMSKLRRTR
jgi:hypothetical protein